MMNSSNVPLISKSQFREMEAINLRAFYARVDSYLEAEVDHWPGALTERERRDHIVRWHQHSRRFHCESEQEVVLFAELCCRLRTETLSSDYHPWYVLQLSAEEIDRARTLAYLCSVAQDKSERSAV